MRGRGSRTTDRTPAAEAALEALLARVRGCRLCAGHLPLGPKPVLQAGATARLLIVGQAPGTRVHATGLPWNDPSGDLLREWLAIDRDVFYDESRVAIVPMGFCYPGRTAGGDAPPRRECAPAWHAQLLELLPHIQLTLLVGRYAQAWYLGKRARPTVAETVRARAEYAPRFLPLPHPSPRNRRWLKQNAWFGAQVVPELRRRAAALL